MSFSKRLRERLEAAAETGELVAIHVDHSEPDAFIVGVAERIDSKGFLFSMINSEGRHDGFQPTEWDDVFAFHADSEYLASVSALHRNPTPNRPAEWIELPSDPEDALRYAREHRLVVSVRHENESHQGFVRNVGKGWMEIDIVIETGQIDGHFLLNLENVSHVRIGGKEERELEHLHRLRYSGG
ncbi:hypothetical protein EON79_02805 [bacterium]|nr:MAG: hypothetical protein EON79_02805 [bacterium]